jgi:hypothetical protein
MRALRLVPALCLAFLASACQRFILTQPNITLAQRIDVPLSPTVALTVRDDEQSERGREYAAQVAMAINASYPQSIEAVTDPRAPAQDRVNVELRIHRLGAYFHSSKTALLAGETIAVTGKVDDWRQVVAAARTAQPIVSGTVYTYLRGNWSGIAYIDLVVRDLRPGHSAAFTLPLAAERSGPNDFGYFRARGVASEAWDAVSPQLAAFLDATVQKLKAE